jgi:hypothetical protein
MQKRKYQVTGSDDLGDVHIFMSDDRMRAEEVAEAMREDMENVELVEQGDASGAAEPRLLKLDEQNFSLDPSLDSGI